MIDDHQFLQAKRPAMVPQERRPVLQKRHNDDELMIILPNLQDKASCKYKVLDILTEMCRYEMYYKMEFRIED